MTEKEYNEIDAIRRSDLWKMEESPEKYKYYLEHPPEQTAAMAFGTACHKRVLEADKFGDEYAVVPKVDRRTKDGKEKWEKFVAENDGKTMITEEDFNVMTDMAFKLSQCKESNQLLCKNEKCENEMSVIWKDPDTGENCKARCDRLYWDPETERYIVIDYKTCGSAQTERFNQELFRLGYHVQAAMYTEGVQIARGLDYRPEFIFVAQEKKEPYSVNVIRVTEEVMRAGDDKYHELLQKVHDCKELDWWPGYCDDGINETALPGWLSMAEEEEL